ncbi:hypothetical protein [Mesorhizobium sp. AA22]|nr:hypothetical protein [Mesorhizobium sp. AA22]
MTDPKSAAAETPALAPIEPEEHFAEQDGIPFSDGSTFDDGAGFE